MFEIKIEGFEDILFMINFSAQNSLKTVIAEKKMSPGVRKVQKNCRVFIEWTIIAAIVR
jgi:hypothetical protein